MTACLSVMLKAAASHENNFRDEVSFPGSNTKEYTGGKKVLSTNSEIEGRTCTERVPIPERLICLFLIKYR